MSSVADLIVSRLRAAGVRMIFGVPGGGSNLDLIEAAGRAGLPFVLTATETAGALAAMAQAEITGGCGACLTTLGPGVSSVLNGVACAFLDRAPLVVLTDAQTAPEGFEHQRIDHGALMRPITKATVAVEDADVEAVVDGAVAAALAAPRGPVHLDCAWQAAAADRGREGFAAPAGSPALQILPDPASQEVPPPADDLVAKARRPILLVGLEARRAGSAIRDFCERRQIPALVTYKAKGVVPDTSPSYAGVFTNGAIERDAIADADLLIAVGLDPVELLPRTWTFDQPVVFCGDVMPRGHVPVAAGWTDGVDRGLARIDALLPETSWDLEAVRRRAEAARARIRIAPSSALTPDRVVEIVAARLADTHRVTVDAGAHMFPATMLWPVSEPNGMLISNGLSTMGFALPAAVGAALVDRSRPVVALTGDGGLLMCLGELLTAARERLPIVTIVFNDASLSLIEIKQQARKFQPTGVALGDVAWKPLAESVGLAAFRADTADELGLAIEMARAVEGPSLVEARIDRTHYGATLRAIRG